MLQKDIYLADLNPTKGSEQSGIRPIVIISGDIMNNNFPVFIICPISTKIKNYESCLIINKNNKNNLNQDSEVIVFQIRTISKDRLLNKIGEISDEELIKIKNKLFDVLTY